MISTTCGSRGFVIFEENWQRQFLSHFWNLVGRLVEVARGDWWAGGPSDVAVGNGRGFLSRFPFGLHIDLQAWPPGVWLWLKISLADDQGILVFAVVVSSRNRFAGELYVFDYLRNLVTDTSGAWDSVQGRSLEVHAIQQSRFRVPLHSLRSFTCKTLGGAFWHSVWCTFHGLPSSSWICPLRVSYLCSKAEVNVHLFLLN